MLDTAVKGNFELKLRIGFKTIFQHIDRGVAKLLAHSAIMVAV